LDKKYSVSLFLDGEWCEFSFDFPEELWECWFRWYFVKRFGFSPIKSFHT